MSKTEINNEIWVRYCKMMQALNVIKAKAKDGDVKSVCLLKKIFLNPSELANIIEQ